MGWPIEFAARAAANSSPGPHPFCRLSWCDRVGYLLSDWVYVPEGWRALRPEMKTWNDPDVAEAVERHWPTLMRNLQGPGPLGLSHFPWSVTRDNGGYPQRHDVVRIRAGATSRKKDTHLHAGLGRRRRPLQPYSKALFPELEIDYHCYDVCVIVRGGKKTTARSSLSRPRNGAYRKAVRPGDQQQALHYSKTGRPCCARLTAATGEFLYVARLQVIVIAQPSFVVEQRPYRQGYYTQCLSWFLNRQEFAELRRRNRDWNWSGNSFSWNSGMCAARRRNRKGRGFLFRGGQAEAAGKKIPSSPLSQRCRRWDSTNEER